MKCKKYADRLTAFADGELKDRDCSKIRAHLAACASCTDAYDGIRETDEFIETHCGLLHPRPESWGRIRYRILSSAPVSYPRFTLINRWSISFSALAVLAMLIVGFLQFQNMKKPDLDQYISQYIIEREALNASMMSIEIPPGSEIENAKRSLFMTNPFMETAAILPENPFR